MAEQQPLIHQISKGKEKIIYYLERNQKSNGEFESLQTEWGQHPGEVKWAYVDPSPFIQANVLYSLFLVDHPKVKGIIENGVKFLISLKEANGFWRFWPHGGKTHNVPLDMDDTCLCSLVLEKYGIRINNKKKLFKNIGSDGYFKTWILPGRDFFWHPKFSRFLLKDQKYTRSTIDSSMLEVDDREPGVAANVLSYLGWNKETLRCINKIVLEIESNRFSGQYYQDPIFTYYHISRAMVEGIKPFEDLRDYIISHIEKRWNEGELNIFETIIMSLTILNYGDSSHKCLSRWMELILQHADRMKWGSYIYFTSKDRNFRAGSPCLTAALALQAMEIYQKELLPV